MSRSSSGTVLNVFGKSLFLFAEAKAKRGGSVAECGGCKEVVAELLPRVRRLRPPLNLLRTLLARFILPDSGSMDCFKDVLSSRTGELRVVSGGDFSPLTFSLKV